MKTIKAEVTLKWTFDIEDNEEPEETIPQLIAEEYANDNISLENVIFENMKYEEVK